MNNSDYLSSQIELLNKQGTRLAAGKRLTRYTQNSRSMSSQSTTSATPRCLNCGFEAASDSGEWGSVEAPPLGTMTQCPECGSTDILSRQ